MLVKSRPAAPATIW